jgi:hypothetical protein
MFLLLQDGEPTLNREFHLSPRGNGGVACDETGAFIGAVPLLTWMPTNGAHVWRPRACDELSGEMSAQYGLPVDMSSKRDRYRASRYPRPSITIEEQLAQAGD